MRVLVAHPGADFSVDDVFRGWVKGLKACGCEVATYNLHDRLAWYANVKYMGHGLDAEEVIMRSARGMHEKLWEWMPDLIVCISAFYVMPITWQILASRWEHKTAIVFTESPYEDDKQLELVQHAEPEVVVLNDPTHIERFRDVHKTVEYLPHCYDPDVHYPDNVKKTVDFSFVGTAYPSRIRMFEAVDWSGIKATFAGHWKGLADDSPLMKFLLHERELCMENADAADLYRRSKVSANLYRGKDVIEVTNPDLVGTGWAMGPREVELAACQTFFLREPRGEGDELFPMLPTFTDADDFSEQLRWWVEHNPQRERAAEQARARIEDRTFDNNARRLLELVGRT